MWKKDKIFIFAEIFAIAGCSQSFTLNDINTVLQTCILSISLVAAAIALYRSLKQKPKP